MKERRKTPLQLKKEKSKVKDQKTIGVKKKQTLSKKSNNQLSRPTLKKVKQVHGKNSLQKFCAKNKRDFLCVKHHGKLLKNQDERGRGRPVGSFKRKNKQKMAKLMSEEELDNQEQGVQPHVWGPLLWVFLHILGTNYPSDTQIRESSKETRTRIKSYKMFFKSLPGILPCKSCRNHLQENFKLLGFSDQVFANRQSLSRFVFKLHNLVNSQLKKPVPRANLLETRRKYEKFRSSLTGTVPVRTLIRIVPKNCSRATFVVDPRCKQ